MDIRSVDPRTASWESRTQKYRIYFWEQSLPPAPDKEGFASDEYEVTGAADVSEVIAWATANSGVGVGRMYPGSDRTFTLYAVVERGDEIGIVHLLGTDPTMNVG